MGSIRIAQRTHKLREGWANDAKNSETGPIFRVSVNWYLLHDNKKAPSQIYYFGRSKGRPGRSNF